MVDSGVSLVEVELGRAARMVLETCAAVRAREEVLIVTDFRSDQAVVRSLAAAAHAADAIPTVAIMPVTRWAGDDPTAAVDGALDRSTLVIAVTHFSLGHSPKIKDRLEAKSIRYISMPGVDSLQMVTGANTADYRDVAETGARLARVMGGGRTIHVTSDLGTDLTAEIADMPARVDAAMATEMGEIGCFPGGEAWQAPRDGTAHGTVVVDRTIAMLGVLDGPVTYKVRDGRAVEIEGGADAERLRQLIDGVPNADNIGEISIGLNPRAGITGNVSEDKKAWGTVHVALGDNLMYGGTTASPIHLDGVISRPTVAVDGEVLVSDGRIL